MSGSVFVRELNLRLSQFPKITAVCPTGTNQSVISEYPVGPRQSYLS